MFAGKLHKEIEALEEQRALDLTIIEGMTAEQLRLAEAQNMAVLNLRERHEAERRNWSDAMTAKEHLWALEKARLQGAVEVNKANSEKWLRLLHGDIWYKAGWAELGGRNLRLWERHADSMAYERILLPEEEDANCP